MKQQIQKSAAIILLILAIISSSCNGDGQEPSGNSDGTYFLKMSLDGQQIEMESTLAAIIDGNMSIQGNKLDSSSLLNMSIANHTTTGTYLFGAGTGNENMFSLVVNGMAYEAINTNTLGAMTVSIEQIGATYIKGTFSGILQTSNEPISTIEVTNGSFRAFKGT